MYYPKDFEVNSKQSRKKQSKSSERALGRIQSFANSKKPLDNAVKNSQIGLTVKTQKSSLFQHDQAPSSAEVATRTGERGSTANPDNSNNHRSNAEQRREKKSATQKSATIDDGNEHNILDPYSNQSAEYFREEDASREAYFGAAGSEVVQLHSGTSSSFQGKNRDTSQLSKIGLQNLKRNTASTAHRVPNSGADSNLNLTSPTYKACNSKSAKNTTKSTRKREHSNVSSYKGPVNQVTKSQRKKISNLGMVYDQKTMMVPAINGSMVRTSTNELRAMNGQTSQHQQSKVYYKKNLPNTQSKKVNDDQLGLRKRVVSQSPSMSLGQKSPKINQLVASNLPAAECV